MVDSGDPKGRVWQLPELRKRLAGSLLPGLVEKGDSDSGQMTSVRPRAYYTDLPRYMQRLPPHR